nr:iron uptake porin [Hydrococcus sp. Prado102]
MTKYFWSLIKTAPVVVGASILAIQGASAATETATEKLTFQSSDKLIAQALRNGSTTNNSTQQMLGQRGRLNRMDGQLNEKKSESLDQITSVSELRDVEPTAWAYEALRSLVERYGCIVGYPDSTFRGNRALSRWEFAAGVNACLNTIERLIQENVAVLKE